MPTEPPKYQRRWFQFSLRTLMIGVTIFCLVIGSYVAHEAKIVRDRKSELNRAVNMRLIGIDGGDQPKAIPGMRRLLGDVSVNSISMPPDTTTGELDRLRALFPESRVTSDSRLDSPDAEARLE
jgi:hypothetical protein